MAESGGSGHGGDDLKVQPEAPAVEQERVDLAEIERQMHQLFKLRIDVNDMLAFEKIQKMNDVETGTPLFFVHSIEGIATPLKKLGATLPYPAWCFQCTPTTPHDSIESMAQYYINVSLFFPL
jgi:fatty acid synthase